VLLAGLFVFEILSAGASDVDGIGVPLPIFLSREAPAASTNVAVDHDHGTLRSV